MFVSGVNAFFQKNVTIEPINVGLSILFFFFSGFCIFGGCSVTNLGMDVGGWLEL